MVTNPTPPLDLAELRKVARSPDFLVARAWLRQRWGQENPNEAHCQQLADYASFLRSASGGEEAALIDRAEAAERLLAEAMSALGHLDGRLDAICKNDLTKYNHHQARRDGTKPSADGGTIFLAPREIATQARARLAEFRARAICEKDAKG